MKRKNQNHQQDNEDLKRQNNSLDQQSKHSSRNSYTKQWTVFTVLMLIYYKSILTLYFCFVTTVRQLERQLSANGENGDLIGMRHDQNSSESEMSDMDDE